ncbi:PAS domain S-box protein [Azospirillum sp. SYSU D00513]|uniref:PAS domain S-box protein n=1 Tax=Azospirillum sp. SYSU D00513 TaxID=2812561 RepID=UPI001A96A02D|nr:PAS domain S-box protein [Azospirillum sp. SYSU D00513]
MSLLHRLLLLVLLAMLPALVALGMAASGLLGAAAMRWLAAVALLGLVSLLAVWWAGNRFLRGPVSSLIETTRRWRDGDLSARTGLARDGSEIGILGRAFDAMAEDLERKAGESQRVNALAHKMASVLASTTDGVFEVDPDWRVTFMNERARSMTAGSRAVVGQSLWEAYPEAVGSVFDEQYRRAMAEQVPVEFEAYYAPLESWFAVRAFPSRDGLAVFLQDVTARKWSEHALADAENARRQSEERFHSIFELAAVGIERVSLDGRYLDVNAKLCAILGARREELLGGSIRDRAEPADQQAEDAMIGRLQAGDIPSYAVEKRYRRPDGSVVWTLVTSSLARITGGEDAYRIAIVEDITERKAMEEALRGAKEEAERANLAKSRFLAAASHDLRQPLQSLFFFTAALEGHLGAAREGDPAGGDPRAAGMVRHLQEGLDALKELLDSLLDVSRLDAGVVTPTLEEFPLSELFEHLDAAYAPAAAEKGLDWRLESCGGTVRSDRTLLLRLVRNLVENALRYTESGLVRVQCRAEGERVAIIVQDTGIGIPPEHLERIFEEFHQVGNPERDRAQGLGLGLAIVRRLSRLLDHPVEVRSVHGRGSAFRVLVPAAGAQQRAPESAVPARPEPATEGQGRLAVLVDDDAVVLMGLQIILREWGYSVLAAGDPDQAMERLGRQNRVPDIVIADYRLREGRVGTEVVRRVRERFGPQVPGVILTGETGPECLHDAAAHGLRVIHKPVTPRQLSTAVERQLKATG